MNLIQRFLIFLFGLLILVLILRCMRQSVTFTAEKFSESNEVLENPYQGYYHIIGYTLNDTDEAIASHADTYSDSLVLLEINLKNYKNTDISEHALSQLEQIFKDCPIPTLRFFFVFSMTWMVSQRRQNQTHFLPSLPT